MPEIPTVGDFLILACGQADRLHFLGTRLNEVQLFAASRQGADYPSLGLIFSPHVVLLSFFPREFSPKLTISGPAAGCAGGPVWKPRTKRAL